MWIVYILKCSDGKLAELADSISQYGSDTADFVETEPTIGR